MSSALAALAEVLTVELKLNPRTTHSAATSMTSTMQLLIPATSWNWPTDTNGTSSGALYDFCSWMPESASAAQPFTPSTIRFSDGYQQFLNDLRIDGSITHALEKFSDDTYYTTVLYAESGQPRQPAWNISQFPQAWLADVSGDPSTGGTIHVTLPTAGEPGVPADTTCFGLVAPDGADRPAPLSAGPGQSVDIHADAWGQISVRPAGWYDGAFLALRSGGPFNPGITADQFFGPNGLLRNMLTGLCVALNPTVTASVTADFATRLRGAREAGSSLRVGGIRFDSFQVGTRVDPRNGTVQLTASPTSNSPHPVIVGAIVRRVGNRI